MILVPMVIPLYPITATPVTLSAWVVMETISSCRGVTIATRNSDILILYFIL